jgi:hypothetical protein
MGALSSWSALAITHHWLVQLAADRVEEFPFSDYVVLGDDISIAGRKVADSYVEICKEFHVPINNKGIISPPGDEDCLVNFANQVIIGDQNYSPIQIREEIAVTSVSARCEALSRLVRRGLIDYQSPSFLAQAFRACVTSTRQCELGLRKFTRGLLPDGFEDILSSFLLPTPNKAWCWDEENPFTYVYIRLLAGLDVYGGWTYYLAHPALLNSKSVNRSNLLPAFLSIAPLIWRFTEKVAANFAGFERDFVYQDLWFDRLKGVMIAETDVGRRAKLASYWLARPVIEDYLERLTTTNLGPQPAQLEKAVAAHEELLNFINGDPDSRVNVGEFMKLLHRYLMALDDCPEYPAFDSYVPHERYLNARASWTNLKQLGPLGVPSIHAVIADHSELLTSMGIQWNSAPPDLRQQSVGRPKSIVGERSFPHNADSELRIMMYSTQRDHHDAHGLNFVEVPFLDILATSLGHPKASSVWDPLFLERAAKVDRILSKKPRSVRFVEILVRDPIFRASVSL